MGVSNMRESKDLIVGLDIGTSKIVALVAEVPPEGGVNILGLGTASSRGLKKGVVVNIEATVSAIQRALEDAGWMANCKIGQFYTGIAGGDLHGQGGRVPFPAWKAGGEGGLLEPRFAEGP